MRLAMMLTTASCVHLAHVDPRARLPADAVRAAARIEVECGGETATGPWVVDRVGSGVVISERHVLTAAHVVACPDIPLVHVTLSNGRRLRMVVEREDSGADIARLELFSAGSFDLGIAPPLLGAGYADELGWIARPGQRLNGGRLDGRRRIVLAEVLRVRRGDSGSPIYDFKGRLLGIVEALDGRYEPIDPSWLAGT